MLETYRISRTVRPAAPSRRFEETKRFLTSGWFPANREIVKEISLKASSGDYTPDGLDIVDDLKRDPALFCHCIMGLRNVIDIEPRGVDPVSELRKLDTDSLSTLLSAPLAGGSRHSLTRAGGNQRACLNQTVVSCASAEMIGRRAGLEHDTAFLCAMLRQLGATLVAWNFPAAYSRARSVAANNPVAFDRELERIVGQSPTALIRSLARDWGVAPSFLEAIAHTPGHKNVSIAAGALIEACELGEKVAEVITRPNASFSPRELDSLARYFSSGDVRELIEGAWKASTTYLASLPVRKPATGALITARPTQATGAARFGNQTDFEPAFWQKLEEICGKILPGELSFAALTSVMEALPAAGFRGGYFCLLGDDFSLRPIFTAGRNNDSHAVHPKIVRCMREAAFSSVPTRHEGVGVSDKWTTVISGAVEGKNKIAILYVEIADPDAPPARKDSLDLFKVLQSLLKTCLGWD